MSAAIKSDYSNGQSALAFLEDGTGFAHYPNGHVSVCVAKSTPYQNSHFAYDNDRHNTLLLGLDYLGIGHVQTSASSEDKDVKSLTLTEKGALYTERGKIVGEWSWAHQKNQPETPIVINVNDHLTFTYVNRSSMTLQYEYESFKRTIEVGVKQKRAQPNYLVGCRKDLSGKLHPLSVDTAKSLRQRAEDFNAQMLAKHSKIHPKSENLDLAAPIVRQLENAFDTINTKISNSPSPGTTWKSEALSSTIKELPKIMPAGTETGEFTGLGKNIYYGDNEEVCSHKESLPAHLVHEKDGTWKNDTDVRSSLQEMNPVLRRTAVLKCNSGRYSRMAIIDAQNITHSNPTGMIVPQGEALATMTWKQVKADVEAKVSGSEMLACLIGRTGEPQYMAYLRIAALAKQKMTQTQERGIKLVRIDAGEDTSILRELDVRYLPAFVIYKNSKLAYLGPLSGRKQHSSGSYRPKIMIVEPNAKYQLKMEKSIKKLHCDTFICLSANDAVDRLQQMSRSSITGESVKAVFDLVLISNEINRTESQELLALSKRLMEYTKTNRTIVATTIGILGPGGQNVLKSIKWNNQGICYDLEGHVSSPLLNMSKALLLNPLKASGVTDLLNLCENHDNDDLNFGITCDTLIHQLKEIQSSTAVPLTRRRGSIPLTVSDVRISGAGPLCK